MNAVPSAALESAVATSMTPAGHVFAGEPHLDGAGAALAGLVDPLFPTEAGWDAASLVMSPPPGHHLLGRPVCQAPGCSVTAAQRSGICQGCQRRLNDAGLGPEDVTRLPAREQPDRDVHGCLVPACARQWVSGPQGLCRQHLEQRQALNLDVSALLSHPQAKALPACEPCQVPRARASAATALVSTVMPTSCGCVRPDKPTRPWMKTGGRPPSRRWVSVVRSACGDWRRWW